METASAIVPVFAMLALGWMARRFHWLNSSAKEGAVSLVFGILFPVMVFNLLASVHLVMDVAGIVIMLLVCYTLFYLAGRTLFAKWLSPYSQIGSFLLTTAEGGNMALPLFLSIIKSGSASAGDPMLLDLAGILFCFLIIPFLVCTQTAKKTDFRQIGKQVIRSPMILAAVFGLLFNLSGLYAKMAAASWMPVYTAVMNMICAPIIPVVLFSVGFDLKMERGIAAPALRFLVLRLALFAGIIGLFFLLFPERMADPDFLIAVILYFMAPTGFGVLGQIAPLLKSEEQKEYCSAVITLNMAVTLIVYLFCVFLH